VTKGFTEVKIAMTVLKRQFITDAEGNPVGVILPLEEFVLVEDLLEQHFPTSVAPTVGEQAKRTEHSVREAEYFGMWADRQDMQGLSSREWLERLRSQQWSRQ
jgi:hypothetical protein